MLNDELFDALSTRIAATGLKPGKSHMGVRKQPDSAADGVFALLWRANENTEKYRDRDDQEMRVFDDFDVELCHKVAPKDKPPSGASLQARRDFLTVVKSLYAFGTGLTEEGLVTYRGTDHVIVGAGVYVVTTVRIRVEHDIFLDDELEA